MSTARFFASPMILPTKGGNQGSRTILGDLSITGNLGILPICETVLLGLGAKATPAQAVHRSTKTLVVEKVAVETI
ncbi:hypothetical protein TYRP_019248 [Tyrophagus putrescentiae]|nr:hypothetical protein TYRP_019248 [Tyrophagus putrescentiae]